MAARPGLAVQGRGDANAVDAYVHYLRSKLGPEGDRIETVRGVGYRLNGA
jgi:DNA-binding response OmpR family regulator